MFPLVWEMPVWIMLREIRSRGTRIGSPQMSSIRIDMLSGPCDLLGLRARMMFFKSSAENSTSPGCLSVMR